MLIRGASAPFRYRPIGRADLAEYSLAGFQSDDVERFLGPIERIRAEVLDGASHVLTVVESAGTPVGFFVTHPDRRYPACWWVGYLAVSPVACGHGVGREMLASAIRRLSQVPGCGRIRLLVDPANLVARRLYARFGFAAEGVWAATGELILGRAVARGGVGRRARGDMRRLTMRRRTAAERSPARLCATGGMVLPGQSPPLSLTAGGSPPLRAAWSSAPAG